MVNNLDDKTVDAVVNNEISQSNGFEQKAFTDGTDTHVYTELSVSDRDVPREVATGSLDGFGR